MGVQPHAVDRAIGDNKRSAEDIVKSLGESPDFLEVVQRAVSCTDVPTPATGAPSFSQLIRIKIAKDLLNESENETPHADEGHHETG